MGVEIIILKAILRESDKAEIFVPDRTETVSEESFEKIMSHKKNFNFWGGRLKFPVSMKQNGDDATTMPTGTYEKSGHRVIMCIRKP